MSYIIYILYDFFDLYLNLLNLCKIFIKCELFSFTDSFNPRGFFGVKGTVIFFKVSNNLSKTEVVYKTQESQLEPGPESKIVKTVKKVHVNSAQS